MNLILFIKDYIRIKGWRDERKAKLVFDNSKLSNLTEKSKSSRQIAPNIIENNPIDAAGLALPTEFFGPIQKSPLYQINQNVSIRPDTTPGVSKTKSYRKEGRIQDISHNRIEYIYGVNILL